MMITSRAALLALSALALVSSSHAADTSLLRKKDSSAVEGEAPADAHRVLDANWAITDPPTDKPTKKPTRRPTRRPTTPPTNPPTRDRIVGGTGIPDICGTLPCEDDSGLILGDYRLPSWKREPNYFDCNNDKGHWFVRTIYSPMYAYKFALTKTCKYQFLAPEFNNQWRDSEDVNTWFAQMAIVLKREGHRGYKASDDDMIYNGEHIPDYRRDVNENPDDCPEKYCVKVVGPAISRRSVMAGAETDAPSASPTESPSISPTSFPTVEKATLKNIAVNPRQTLNLCEGDCDTDNNCAEGLVCFQRNAFQDVPGCVGKGNKMWDYCVKPYNADTRGKVGQSDSHKLTLIGNNGNPKAAFPLGMCQGDCDDDDDCRDDLICQQRNAMEPVPGCAGMGNRGHDYCRKPDKPLIHQPYILYAFSHVAAWTDFRIQLKSAMDSREKDHIFLTNHFKRCGCESFCYEDFKHMDGVRGPYGTAVCYVEPMCGYNLFQIHYDEEYPDDKKVSWADTGTSEVLKWFDACAEAMYGCKEFTDFDKSEFVGTNHQYWNSRYKGYPKVFKYESYEVSPLPYITSYGVNPSQMLYECEGDCDKDDHCGDGLVCLQRNGHEPIPGCQGDRHRGWDYCIKDPLANSKSPKLVSYGVHPTNHYPLGECEGDCDSDGHCKEGFRCFQRNGFAPVNGCDGEGLRDYDYCVKIGVEAPAPTSAPTPYVSIDTYQNVYGLGGSIYYGFEGGSDSTMAIGWQCPSMKHRGELEFFGTYVQKAQLFRDPGDDDTYPKKPCPDYYEPLYPELNPVTPSCDDIEDTVYCYQMDGATCYAKIEEGACDEVNFYMMNKTNTYVYDDVAEWNDACLASGNSCRRREDYEKIDGKLTYKGRPNGVPYWSDHFKWAFAMYNARKNGQHTIFGNKQAIYYTCESWQGAYSSANFTDGAGDIYDVFNNTYGDLYESKQCTDSPTQPPSDAPSLSVAPSASPSMNPTFCSESYLTSEDLNIALVIDLSYSTYKKSFSAVNPVGDVNGDGKANTILDAQVVAIQELLSSIAKSPTLNNRNSEIGLISFSTDAKDHGVWGPLNSAGDDYNSELMQYVKKNLRAPTSDIEVRDTNNGFTNFDAALDKAVDYFRGKATKGRKNLLVFLSDGVPNVRGDGDNEGYCADTVDFWVTKARVNCDDLEIQPGQPHKFCLGNDANCALRERYQDCVRGPNNCNNAEAVTQYRSEIDALNELSVERLAIGVGDESNIARGSALWMIDNNPAKKLGVLPLQALNLDELSEYLSSLCILNTEPPTRSPSSAPTDFPTVSPAPSLSPTNAPTKEPSDAPSDAPTKSPTKGPTKKPTEMPTGSPTTGTPTTVEPTSSPSTVEPTSTPSTADPTSSPSTVEPTSTPSTVEPTSSPSTVEPTSTPSTVETMPPFITNRKETPSPESECPEDIVVATQKGTVTELPRGTVRIVSQNRTSVTVELVNTFSSGDEPLDGFYYQYQETEFSTKCYDNDDLQALDTVQVTMQCRVHSPVALLEIWVADALDKGSLSSDDNAEIPKCCHPGEPDGTPAAHYVIVIKCETACPERVG